MTDREAQIFHWIAENPMISQEELAQKAGIKRSSVAVHISNLMRKGYIQGKGYIMNTPLYCTVIGGANMDIGGVSDEILIDNDSNPGTTTISLGGVGRNIAHNIALLGAEVKFITALGMICMRARLLIIVIVWELILKNRYMPKMPRPRHIFILPISPEKCMLQYRI